MAADEMRKAIMRIPFEPFTIISADGTKIPVVGRDFIFISPNGRTLNIYQKDNSSCLLDTMLVTSIQFAPPKPESIAAADLVA
jgi:hypothetical protein